MDNKLKIIKEFEELGCKDSSKCAMSYYVLCDLIDNGTEILEKKYLNEEDLIYIIGKDENGRSNLYLPVSSWQDISFLVIDDIQTKICKTLDLTFMLSVCDTSGTVLYYSMKGGPPPDIIRN